MQQRIAILARTLGENCLHRAWFVVAAESCSGGRLAAAMTHSPGSSAWFSHSLVTYSNRAKNKYLGVNLQLLSEEGAVSEACAWAMLQGLERETSQLGMSITGFAGPALGDENHAVGTVFLAWMNPEGEKGLERLHLRGGRGEIIEQVVYYALRRLILSSLYPAVYQRLNYFFALLFQEPGLNEACWQHGLAAGLPLAALEPKENIHITLAYLGQIKSASIPELFNKAATVCHQQAPFSLSFHRLIHWPSSDAYVLESNCPQALIDFQQKLSAQESFKPHITLAKAVQLDLTLEDTALSGSWTVVGLQLMASWHGVFYLEQQRWTF